MTIMITIKTIIVKLFALISWLFRTGKYYYPLAEKRQNGA